LDQVILRLSAVEGQDVMTRLRDAPCHAGKRGVRGSAPDARAGDPLLLGADSSTTPAGIIEGDAQAMRGLAADVLRRRERTAADIRRRLPRRGRRQTSPAPTDVRGEALDQQMNRQSKPHAATRRSPMSAG